MILICFHILANKYCTPRTETVNINFVIETSSIAGRMIVNPVKWLTGTT